MKSEAAVLREIMNSACLNRVIENWLEVGMERYKIIIYKLDL